VAKTAFLEGFGGFWQLDREGPHGAVFHAKANPLTDTLVLVSKGRRGTPRTGRNRRKFVHSSPMDIDDPVRGEAPPPANPLAAG
jgi:hypothetical protein